MIKEAMEYLLSLREPKVIEVDGRKFTTDALLHLPREKTATELGVHSLSGIVDFLNDNVEGWSEEERENVFVTVDTARLVSVRSRLNRDQERNCYLYAQYDDDDRPSPNPRTWDQDSFIVFLQTGFVQDENLKNLLAFVSKIKTEESVTMTDDGVSQNVTAKTGVSGAMVERVKTPNPITLKPFRTFTEIEQPESLFVLRIKNRGDGVEISLHEADGGYWELTAIQRIKDYLTEKLGGHFKVIA